MWLRYKSFFLLNRSFLAEGHVEKYERNKKENALMSCYCDTSSRRSGSVNQRLRCVILNNLVYDEAPRPSSFICHVFITSQDSPGSVAIEVIPWKTTVQPASLRAVLHVMPDLPADPAAPVVGRQLAVCQHLRIKEVLLQQDRQTLLSLVKSRFPPFKLWGVEPSGPH